MRIAVIGCSHGSLDDIYASVAQCDQVATSRGEPPVDLVICCGDFQAMRNTSDLEMMACPPKYRALGQFHEYYSEHKRADKLTIVIGGNHESSGYLWETYHGGWLAPNVYFLGFAGCVLVDGWLRIAGASGIWKSGDWKKGHFETVPYDDRTIRSVYHIREYDVARLLQLKGRGPAVDLFLSHDWPLGIEQHGDTEALLRAKPFFRDEVATNSLGSPPLHAVLEQLQPRYWFAAHLHVKFAAVFKHGGHGDRTTRVKPRRVRQWGTASGYADASAESTEPPPPRPNQDEGASIANPDEIVLDDDEDDEEEDDDDNNTRAGGLGGIVSEEKGCPEGCGAGSSHEHRPDTIATAANPDEIPLEDDDDEEMNVDPNTTRSDPPPAPAPGREEGGGGGGPGANTTRFLALGKPGRNKDFLQIVDVSPPPDLDLAASNGRPELFFDPHWLAIVRATNPFLSLERAQTPFPPLADLSQQIDREYAWVVDHVGARTRVADVMKFERTALTEQDWRSHGAVRIPSWFTNPQTVAFSSMLGIENKINPIPEGYVEAMRLAHAARDAEDQARLRAELEQAKRDALREVDLAGERIDEEPEPIVPADDGDRAAPGPGPDADAVGANADEIQVEDEDD
ncbi:hypothetical protein JCM11491_006921 [Sporobolomyces phaffii]